MAGSGIEVVDTGATGKNFNDLCRAAQYQSKDERLALEKIIIEKWAEDFDDIALSSESRFLDAQARTRGQEGE